MTQRDKAKEMMVLSPHQTPQRTMVRGGDLDEFSA